MNFKADSFKSLSLGFGRDWHYMRGSQEVPVASRWMRSNKYRGDFLAVWMRKEHDQALFQRLADSWLDDSGYKLVPINPKIPNSADPDRVGNLERFQTFLRSDHASFWFHKNEHLTQSLEAVLLTDMGMYTGLHRTFLCSRVRQNRAQPVRASNCNALDSCAWSLGTRMLHNVFLIIMSASSSYIFFIFIFILSSCRPLAWKSTGLLPWVLWWCATTDTSQSFVH